MRSRTLPSKRRKWKRWVFLSLVLVAGGGYVGSYYHFSRRGVAELCAVCKSQSADELRSGTFFFYVPLSDIGPDSPGLTLHYRRRAFYDPINQLDRVWFGGWTPCGGMTWGFTKPGDAGPELPADMDRSP
jgi:hypothetical protein